ncbi:MAG: hypothetical protein IKJ29_06500 [Akkermansia sp.]|nr:hypothetical protein [Akkermansia sp.]
MKKQIYIGLGGQGGKTICELRKQIHQLQLYKKANENSAGFNADHAFLSIDSSPDIWNTGEAWFHMGEDLSLKENEKCELSKDLINTSAPNIVPWLFSDDYETAMAQKSALGTIDKGAPGAQQRRRYGRLLFAANADRVRDAIENTMVRASQNNREASAVFHVFCSLGGGTGSGGIVDLITTLRVMYPSRRTHNINLYVYMADERGVKAASVYDYFYVNQYATLRDLDNLSTHIFRPHAMINREATQVRLGSRVSKLDSPIDCLFISTNVNSVNQAVHINEQIKRTASWVISRASLEEGCLDHDIHKLATGEDLTASVRGEPDDETNTFIARSYRCGNLGAARWAAPVDELALMSAYSIQMNSYRQMLYNNLQRNRGYVEEEAELNLNDKAAYNKVFKNNFLLAQEVQAGWQQWIASDPGIQGIMQGKQDAAALLKLSKLFESYFQDSVLSKNTSCSISLPNRHGMILGQMRALLGLGDTDTTATGLSLLIMEQLKLAITQAWDNGSIGLKQALQIIEFCIETTSECHEQLCQEHDAMGDKGALITTVQERIAQRQAEWEKLTALSYATMGKGKSFLKAHMADLVAIYTAKTQRQHIADIIQELETHKDRLRSLKDSIQRPITAITRKLDDIKDKYHAITLRRFIEEGVRPGEDLVLMYDFNYADPALIGLVSHVQTNTDAGQGQTIIKNAEAIRQLATASRIVDPALPGLFDRAENIDARTDGSITVKSFELAGTMMRDSDRRYASNIMGGIKTVTANMTTADFKSKFRKLINSAAFSYDTDDTTPSPTIAYAFQNIYKKAWVISFPIGFRLDGQEKMPDELKAEVQSVIGNEATDDSVYVRMSADTTQISLWEMEYARPARTARIVTTHSNSHRSMEARGKIRDLFWMNIDEESTRLMCPLTFPNYDETEYMRQGAMWFAKQMPGYFLIKEEGGRVIRKGSGTNRDVEIHRTKGQNPITNDTLFAFEVQTALRLCICQKREFTTADFRTKYQAELDAITNYDEREAFRTIGDEFILKTLARIDLTQHDMQD